MMHEGAPGRPRTLEVDPGGRRPAMTTMVSAGSDGRYSSRSQSSIDSSRSAASSMITNRSDGIES